MPNIIDDFFQAATWTDALTLCASRRGELLGEDARAAMSVRVRKVQHSNSAYDALSFYNEILGHLSRGMIPSAVACANIPKLTDEHFEQLAAINGASSARAFVGHWPEVAEFLVAEQVVFGPDFWRLLFSWCTLRLKTSTSNKRNTVVVLNQGETTRRICKLIPLADGGFSLAAPYHNAQSGLLLKVPRVRDPGHSLVAVSDMVPFTASDRVKLSYHVDGFVQFSGVNNKRIRSGIENGVPKGLGLITNPLTQPVQTGPSVGCMVWGFEDFALWKRRSDETAILFDAGDFYEEPDWETTGQDCCSLSAFVFPLSALEDAVGKVATGDELEMRLPMNIYHPRSLFRVKIIKVSEVAVLGLFVQRGKCSLGSPSGFQLSGPSDKEHCLMAMYPPMAEFANAPTLDYSPPS